jgi:hypothetical protein
MTEQTLEQIAEELLDKLIPHRCLNPCLTCEDHHEQVLTALQAAEARGRQASLGEPQWRDIESAPFGERVLVYCPKVERFVSGVFSAVLIRLTGRWVQVGGGALSIKPTHWLPLPPPPGSATTDG